MNKFLIGFAITIIYSFSIYIIDKNKSLIGVIAICTASYYLGDMVVYKYMGNLS